MFRPIYDRTNGVDGWVSLEVSPLLAHDTTSTFGAVKDLFRLAARPNLFIKIPGTKEGLPAIKEAIFAGIPVNVTLLFSREHYFDSRRSVLRGIERRIDAGFNANVGSVALVFISHMPSPKAEWRRVFGRTEEPPKILRSALPRLANVASQRRAVSTDLTDRGKEMSGQRAPGPS